MHCYSYLSWTAFSLFLLCHQEKKVLSKLSPIDYLVDGTPCKSHWFQVNINWSFQGGTGGGPSTTREEKIKTIVDDIMEKLPDPFSMSEIMGKVEERTPYVVVAFQVILYYLRKCTLKRVRDVSMVFLRKWLHFWQKSIFIFGRSYFVRPLSQRRLYYCVFLHHEADKIETDKLDPNA